jgi:hypothetical protein
MAHEAALVNVDVVAHEGLGAGHSLAARLVDSNSFSAVQGQRHRELL